MRPAGRIAAVPHACDLAMTHRRTRLLAAVMLVLILGACTRSEKVQVKETTSETAPRRPSEAQQAAPVPPPSMVDELVEPVVERDTVDGS
jgi:hypothetical protein